MASLYDIYLAFHFLAGAYVILSSSWRVRKPFSSSSWQAAGLSWPAPNLFNCSKIACDAEPILDPTSDTDCKYNVTVSVSMQHNTVELGYNVIKGT
jgi:hypothetical protein